MLISPPPCLIAILLSFLRASTALSLPNSVNAYAHSAAVYGSDTRWALDSRKILAEFTHIFSSLKKKQGVYTFIIFLFDLLSIDVKVKVNSMPIHIYKGTHVINLTNKLL